MYIKRHELLNSEGPILTIEKHNRFWHWKFYSSDLLRVTTPKEILDFLTGKITIRDHEGRSYDWKSHGYGMKGDNVKRMKAIVKELLEDEIDYCNLNENHFIETYYMPK